MCDSGQMTRAKTPIPASASAESDTPAAPVDPQKSSSSPVLAFAKSTALGLLAGSGSLAKSGGALGAYLLGQGVTLTKTAIARRNKADENPKEIAVAAAPSGRGRGLKRVVLFGALGAAVVGGVALWRKTRFEPAPVADQPPSLREVEPAEL